MTRSGSTVGGLLHDLHADGCDGREFSTCRPVTLPDERGQSARIEVVLMAWCEECNAAEWEVV